LHSARDFVIIQDVDLEHDSADFAFMLEQSMKQDVDVCYGNRFRKNNGVIYWHNFYGNLFLSVL